MYIHIGDREVISDKRCIGIFNVATLALSDDNHWLTTSLQDDVKTLALLDDGKVVSSKVSPFTVIKRTSFDSDKDVIWRKNND
jgi:hypothetical protein